jgi:pimeloyl-ACP methyl ester carboxylesterase
MSPDELEAAGSVAGQGFGAVVRIARDTHRAFAGRVFGTLETVGSVAGSAVSGLAGSAIATPVKLAIAPVRLTHDAIADLVYVVTEAIGDAALRGAGLAAAVALADQQGELPVRVALGALNGAFGDMLEAQGSPLATPMSARVDGELRPPAARLAVFIHGLCETEDAWFLYRERGVVYGRELHDRLGYTPVYLRYNSGLAIEENGRRLAAMLTDLVSEAPVPVHEVVLVGHSMGGLVARSACGELAGTDTGALVRHVVLLGAPHRGAPLEQAAALTARVLAAVPETRAFATALDGRSTGIRDLAIGIRPGTPYAEEIEHYFFSAGLTGALERAFGDLLVHRRSAWDIGRGEQVRFAPDRYRHLADANHFDLLGHPAIGEQLVRWLSGAESGGRLIAAG